MKYGENAASDIIKRHLFASGVRERRLQRFISSTFNIFNHPYFSKIKYSGFTSVQLFCRHFTSLLSLFVLSSLSGAQQELVVSGGTAPPMCVEGCFFSQSGPQVPGCLRQSGPNEWSQLVCRPHQRKTRSCLPLIPPASACSELVLFSVVQTSRRPIRGQF